MAGIIHAFPGEDAARAVSGGLGGTFLDEPEVGLAPGGPAVTPRIFKGCVIALAVAYLLLPIDLIPDVTGVGVVDDLALMGLLAWFYRSQVAKLRTAEKSPPQLPARAKSFDPYRVLEVPASASAQAIRTAYRARMNEYHPDKVAHLGKELQDLAHDKSVEIQQAYRQLSQ